MNFSLEAVNGRSERSCELAHAPLNNTQLQFLTFPRTRISSFTQFQSHLLHDIKWYYCYNQLTKLNLKERRKVGKTGINQWTNQRILSSSAADEYQHWWRCQRELALLSCLLLLDTRQRKKEEVGKKDDFLLLSAPPTPPMLCDISAFQAAATATVEKRTWKLEHDVMMMMMKKEKMKIINEIGGGGGGGGGDWRRWDSISVSEGRKEGKRGKLEHTNSQFWFPFFIGVVF